MLIWNMYITYVYCKVSNLGQLFLIFVFYLYCHILLLKLNLYIICVVYLLKKEMLKNKRKQRHMLISL